MAYLICCEYPAHPPADGSSTAKGSADTVLVVTLRFARCSFPLDTGFVACCYDTGELQASSDWHNTELQILAHSRRYHAQHNTAQHNTAQHSTALYSFCEALIKTTRNDTRDLHSATCLLPA